MLKVLKIFQHKLGKIWKVKIRYHTVFRGHLRIKSTNRKKFAIIVQKLFLLKTFQGSWWEKNWGIVCKLNDIVSPTEWETGIARTIQEKKTKFKKENLRKIWPWEFVLKVLETSECFTNQTISCEMHKRFCKRVYLIFCDNRLKWKLRSKVWPLPSGETRHPIGSRQKTLWLYFIASKIWWSQNKQEVCQNRS